MKKIPVRQLNVPQPELPSGERFKIRRVEDIVGDTGLVHDLHRHDFFFILAVKKGGGSHEIDFTPYEVSDHAVFILRPGQVHQLELDAGCTGYLLEFNSEFYHPKGKSSDLRLRKAGSRNFCLFDAGRFEKMHTLLGMMFREYAAREEGYADAIKSGLDLFFIEFLRQSPNPKGQAAATGSYTQERFEEFSTLLEQHVTSQKQVSKYLEMMNLSAYQLNEITKSSIGKTASELINDHIILEAKRYLLATPNQVKDIADHLGYDDVSYFIRFFRKHTGSSPEAFRQHFR